MNDPQFEAAILQLRSDQKAEFAKISPKSLEEWKTRIFPERDANLPAKQDKFYQQRTKQKLILAREEFVNDTGPSRRIRRNEAHSHAQNLVHELMLTQKYENTTGLTSGKIFQHQLDKSLLDDPDAVEKIKAAVIAVRDCFPKNMPLVLTFHRGKPARDKATGVLMLDKYGEKIYKEPHLQGWVCDRTWNKELGAWNKEHEILDIGGIGQLRKSVDEAVLKATGTVFGDPTKKLDPNRPKRTVYNKQVNARVSYWSKTLSHADMAAGKAIKLEQNPLAKEALRQFVAQVRYDDNKSAGAETKRLMASAKNAELRQVYGDYEDFEAVSNYHASLEKKAEFLKGTDARYVPLTEFLATRQELREVEAEQQPVITAPEPVAVPVVKPAQKPMLDLEYVKKFYAVQKPVSPFTVPPVTSPAPESMPNPYNLTTPEQLDSARATQVPAKTSPKKL